jgi:chromosome segregation ATPase
MRLAVPALVAVSLLWVTYSCKESVPKEQYDKLQAELDQMESLKDKQEKEFGEMLDLMNQIQQNLARIDQSKLEIAGNKNKDVIFQRINNIDSLIKANRSMIASLNAKVNESGMTIKGLREQIASFDALLKNKESEMEQLRGQIANLNTEKAELQKTVAYKEEAIKQKETVIQTKDTELAKRDSIIRANDRKYRQNQAVALIRLGEREEKLGDKVSGLFNPAKKKSYYQNACKYYQEAVSLGSDEAKDKIDNLKVKTKQDC